MKTYAVVKENKIINIIMLDDISSYPSEDILIDVSNPFVLNVPGLSASETFTPSIGWTYDEKGFFTDPEHHRYWYIK